MCMARKQPRPRTKKPSPSIHVARVHAVLDELLYTEGDIGGATARMMAAVDWGMVDFEVQKRVFALIMANSSNDPDDGLEYYDEQRRLAIAQIAEREHRRIVAEGISRKYAPGAVDKRAAEIAAL